jgi:hypothetical protein
VGLITLLFVAASVIGEVITACGAKPFRVNFFSGKKGLRNRGPMWTPGRFKNECIFHLNHFNIVSIANVATFCGHYMSKCPCLLVYIFGGRHVQYILMYT